MKPEIPKLPHSALSGTTYPVVIDLPAKQCRDIGKIVSAHAQVEHNVFELLVALCNVERPTGRVAFRYQAAIERFKTCKRLMTMHGLRLMGITKLQDDIEECCRVRDQFAHGIWVRAKDNGIELRLTRGEYDVDGGTADRSFLPQRAIVPDAFADETRQAILVVAQKVKEVRDRVAEILTERRARSESPAHKPHAS